MNHTKTPRLKNPDDLYWDGRGCSWGTDLDGKRYDKVRRPPSKSVRPGQYNSNRNHDRLNDSNDDSFWIAAAGIALTGNWD
jgi:hypothetical protein